MRSAPPPVPPPVGRRPSAPRHRQVVCKARYTASPSGAERTYLIELGGGLSDWERVQLVLVIQQASDRAALSLKCLHPAEDPAGRVVSEVLGAAASLRPHAGEQLILSLDVPAVLSGPPHLALTIRDAASRSAQWVVVDIHLFFEPS